MKRSFVYSELERKPCSWRKEINQGLGSQTFLWVWVYLAEWLFLRVYFCHFLTPGFSQSNSNCVLSNRDVTYIAENNLYPFNSSGLADRAAKAPEMIFVSPCAFAPQVPGSRCAITDPGAEQKGCGQPLPAGTRRPAWQNPPGGSTGAWKTLGTWLLIDFTFLFDTESGDNIPVVITLKACTVIQNNCQQLPSLAHAAF